MANNDQKAVDDGGVPCSRGEEASGLSKAHQKPPALENSPPLEVEGAVQPSDVQPAVAQRVEQAPPVPASAPTSDVTNPASSSAAACDAQPDAANVAGETAQARCLAKYWIANCIPGSPYRDLVSDHPFKQQALGDFNLRSLIIAFADVLGTRLAPASCGTTVPASDLDNQVNQLAAAYKNEYFSDCSEAAKISAECAQDIRQWIESKFERTRGVSVIIKRFEVFISAWIRRTNGFPMIEDFFTECSEIALAKVRSRPLSGSKRPAIPFALVSTPEHQGTKSMVMSEGPKSVSSEPKSNDKTSLAPVDTSLPPIQVAAISQSRSISTDRPSETTEAETLAMATTKEASQIVEAPLYTQPPTIGHPDAAAAWAEEQTGLAKDRTELQSWFAQSRSWSERTTSFRNNMASVVEVFTQTTADASNIIKDLPPDVRPDVQSKQEGLTLTARMVGRLTTRLPKDVDSGEQELPVVGEARWGELLREVSDAKAAEARIKRELELVSTRRYEVVISVRDAVTKARKSLLKFVERDLLPVLDALDDGERLSKSAIAELKAKQPDASEKLETWFSNYTKLRTEMLRILNLAGVRYVDVAIGTPISYDRHQPFDVEPDPTLPNEHIKALVRNGYEYIAENGETTVLRAAQVVAVKNSPSPAGQLETTNPAAAVIDNPPTKSLPV